MDNMYKDIFKGYFSLMMVGLLSSFLNAGANQIWLTNGVWQPVGVQGIYKLDQSATSWAADFTNVIEDRADSNATYARGDEATADNYYVDKDNNITKTYHTQTSQLHGTVGLFAIKGGTSKKVSNYIDLDGSKKNNVKMKIINIRNKDYNLPMYRMYIEGRPNVPAIRLDYQANYEGDKFRIRFGNEEEDYYGFFRSSATFQHPARLQVEVINKITSSSPIDRAVDFNISDNSLLLLAENSFKILNDDGTTVGGDGVTRFDSAKGDFLTMYSYNGYKWDIFNSTNINVGSNDFEKFSPGTGYWMLAESKNANSDNNRSKIGIITKDENEILDESYKDVVDGWNMLSFPEGDLRYATSGMFIPLDAIFAEHGINLFFSHLGKLDTNKSHSRENNIILEANSTLSYVKFREPADVAQYINLAIKNKKVLYSEETNLRAFPAMNIEGATTKTGIILISDHTFEVNSSNATITTLTGSSLMPTSYGTYSSIYGEYFLGIEMNDLSGTEINGSVDIFMPGASFNSAGAKAYDLNNSPSDIVKTAKTINMALSKASVPLNATAQGTPTKTFLIDFNFKTNIPTHYQNPANFKSILLSTQTRFSIRDTTYMQVFKHEHNGSFYVAGTKSELTTSGGGTTLKDAINSKIKTTNIVYTDLGNNYFSISSPTIRNLDLLEADSKFDSKLFDDISLNDGDIPRKDLTRGAVTFVRDHRNIMSVDIKTDLTILEGSKTTLPNDSNFSEYNVSKTDNGGFKIVGRFPFSSGDLKPNAIWSTDFPQQDGPINIMARQGKDILEIMTMNKSTANENYWAHTDLTKDPNDWYTSDQKDTQDVFHIFNQKAYWVKLKTKIKKQKQSVYANNKNTYIDKTASIFSRRIYTHFNNHIINAIGETKNHLDHTLTIKIDPAFMKPNEHSYYDVLAVIAGEEHRLRHNGQGFQMRISSNELNIREKTDNVKYPILIKAYDGFGGKFEESVTNHVWDMDFSKPKVPVLSWDETTGDLIIKTEQGTIVEIYKDYVSDISIDRLKNKINNKTLYKNEKLSWKVAGNPDEGAMKILKIVAKKKIANNNFLYSDMKVFPYIPLKLKEGTKKSKETLHILSIDKDSGKNTASNPYSFKQKQYLTFKDPSDSIIPKYNGINGIDNGVEIVRLKKAIDNQKSIKMIYAPIGDNEGDKRLSAFGGNETMYLNLLSKFNSDPKPIAYITYVREYAGKTFYISYDGNLYKGTFANSDNHNSDTSAYNLYSGSISAYFDTRGTQGNLIDYSRSTLNSQPIIIPIKPTPPPTKDTNVSSDTNGTIQTPPLDPNLP
jgi:hypothetical protein